VEAATLRTTCRRAAQEGTRRQGITFPVGDLTATLRETQARPASLIVYVLRHPACGREKVYAEKKSGLDGKRLKLAKCLDCVGDGDVLRVTKLGRRVRSTSDL
jgi:hypothetical protein